jgi:hypothetical protein
MYKSEQLIERWKPVLDQEGLTPIKDPYKRAVVSILLQNARDAMIGERVANGELVLEAGPTVQTDGGVTYGTAGTIKGFDSVLLGMLRRSQPNLVAFDLCGVQPMKSPVSMIFALRARYVDDAAAANWSEALYNEADTSHSGTGTHTTDLEDAMFPLASRNSDFGIGTGMSTASAEALGVSGGTAWAEMGISIERTSVTALTRGLKAEWSTELQQDLQNVHGINAENELSNILSTQILAEQNREIIRLILKLAKAGAAVGTTAAGIFDLDTDSGGRHFLEKVKGLMYQIEREANVIAKETRRGRGNKILCSSDVASALSIAGLIDSSGLKDNLKVDDTGNTYVGVLNNRFDVYVDPYYSSAATANFFVVGYKGPNAIDAGLFYCPYVPLQVTKVTDPSTMQPKMGFKTRYGIAANPFACTTPGHTGIETGYNCYYRAVQVNNIL